MLYVVPSKSHLQDFNYSFCIFHFFSAFSPPSRAIFAPFMHLPLDSSSITKFLAFAALTSSVSSVNGKRSFADLEEYKQAGDSVLSITNQRFRCDVILFWVLSIAVSGTL